MKAMKKMMILVLAAGLYFSAVSGFAAPKDSTWLANENVMTSIIDKSTDGSPIGMVSIWATADPIPDGWLECNGQIVNATKYPEYVAKFGATVPDYRGFFLRGYGGKSGELGVAQDYAVQTNGSNLIKIQGIGEAQVDYLTGLNYVAPTMPNYGDALDSLASGVNSALNKANNAGGSVAGIKGDVDRIARKVLGVDANVPMTFEQYVNKFYVGSSKTDSGRLSYAGALSNAPDLDLGISKSSNTQVNVRLDNEYYLYKGTDRGGSNIDILNGLIDDYNKYLSSLGYAKMFTYNEFLDRQVSDLPSPDKIRVSGSFTIHSSRIRPDTGQTMNVWGKATYNDVTITDFLSGNFPCTYNYPFVSGSAACGKCDVTLKYGSLGDENLHYNCWDGNGGNTYQQARDRVLAKYNAMKSQWSDDPMKSSNLSSYNDYIYSFRPNVPMTFQQYLSNFYVGSSSSDSGRLSYTGALSNAPNLDLGISKSSNTQVNVRLDNESYLYKGTDRGGSNIDILNGLIDDYNKYLSSLGYNKMFTFDGFVDNQMSDLPSPDKIRVSGSFTIHSSMIRSDTGQPTNVWGKATYSDVTITDFLSGNFPCTYSSEFVSGSAACGKCDVTLRYNPTNENLHYNCWDGNGGNTYQQARGRVLAKYNAMKSQWSDDPMKSSNLNSYNDYIYEFNPVSSSNGMVIVDNDNIGSSGGDDGFGDGFTMADYTTGHSGSLTSTSASNRVVVPNSSQSMQNLAVTITSDAGETRPVNKAVKYIIKVE